MKPTEIIQPMTLEQVQTLRRLSRHPDFRSKAADLVEMFRKSCNQVREFTEGQRVQLADYEAALAVAIRKVQEAEAIMAEGVEA